MAMTDGMRFPVAYIVDFYEQRWEIEWGFREMKKWCLIANLPCEAISWIDKKRVVGGTISL